MAIDVAELRTLVSADASQFDQTLNRAEGRLQAFSARQWKAQVIKVDAASSLQQVQALTRAYEKLRADLARPLPALGAPGGAAAGNTRPSTADPAKVAATTAAQVDQINRTAEAKASASQSRQTEIVAQAAAKRDAIESGAAARTAAIRDAAAAKAQAQATATASKVASAAQVAGAAQTRAAQSTATQVERINNTSAAKQGASAARTSSQVAGIEARGATARGQAQLSAQQKTEQLLQRDAELAAQRRARRVADIEAREAARTARRVPLDQRLQNSGYNWTRSGAVLSATVTAPALMAGRASVGQALKFDDTLRKTAALSALTDANIDKMKASILALTNNPLIRRGPQDLAEGFWDVASTTHKSADALEILKNAAIGASAGLGTTKDSAALATSVIAAYKMEATDSARIMDVLTVAVKEGKAEADSYTGAMGGVISTAAIAGVSFEEVAASLATMTRLGISTEESVTALNNVLLKLANPSKGVRDKLDAMGTSVEELRAKLKNAGLAQTLQDLLKVSGGDIGDVAELFPNVRALKGVLATAGAQADTYKQILAQTNNAAGATAKAAADASTSAQFQLDRFQASVSKTAILLGNTLLPKIGEVAEEVGHKLPFALDNASRAWDGLPDPIKKTVIALGAVLLLSGPMAMMVGNIQLLAGALIGLGRIAGIGSLIGTLRTLLPLLAGISSIADVGAFASIAATALGPFAVALAALIPIYEGVMAAVYNYQAALGDADIAAHNAQMATDSYARTLESALKYAKASPGTKTALTQLEEQAKAAGEDTGKLIELIRAATALKMEIGKDMKLSPSGKAIVQNDLQRFINNLSANTIELKVHVNGEGARAEAQQSVSNAKAGKALSWDERAARAGTTMPSAPQPVKATGIPGWLGMMNPVTDVDRDYFRIQTEQSKSTIQTYEKKNGLTAAATAVTRTLTTAQQAQTVVVTEQTKAVNKLKDAELAREQKRLDGLATAGKLTIGSPDELRARDVETESDKRKNQIQTQWASNKAERDAKAQAAARQAEGDAKKASDQRDRAEQALENRRRQRQAQGINKQADSWSGFGQMIEGFTARVMEMDAATEAAKLQARMLRDEFAGIPPHLQKAALEVAKLSDKLEALAGRRDSLRDLNNATVQGLIRSGADPRAFLASVKAQEAAFGYGQKIPALRNEILSKSVPLADNAKNTGTSLRNRAQALTDQPLEDRVNAQSYDGDVAATSAAGAKVAQVVMQRHISGASRGFVKRCQALAETSYYQAGVTAYDAILRQKGSALQTMRRFQKAGVGQKYAPGMALAPGGLLYSDTMGQGSGHVQTIGTDGGRYDQYGRNKFKSSSFQWYVPPPGARLPAAKKRPLSIATRDNDDFDGLEDDLGTDEPQGSRASSAPAPHASSGKAKGSTSNSKAPAKKPVKRQIRLAGSKDEGDLATTPTDLPGWGNFVNEASMKPGETRTNRLARQDYILGELSKPDGLRFSRKELGSMRDSANKADYSQGRSDAIRGATSATRAFVRAEQEKIQVVNAGQAALAKAGATMADYERASFRKQTEIDINKSDDIRALATTDPKKAHDQANSRLYETMRSYDASKADEVQKQIAQSSKEATDAGILLAAQQAFLAANAGKPESVIADGLEKIALRQKAVNELSGNGQPVTQGDIDKYIAEKMAVEDGTKAFDRRRETLKLLTQTEQERKAQQAEAKDENEVAAMGLNEGNKARELSVRAAKRESAQKLQDSIDKKSITQGAANQEIEKAGAAAGEKFDQDSRTKTREDADKFNGESDNRAGLLRAQLAAVQGGAPQADIQDKLLEKRREIEAANKEAAGAAKLDEAGIDARLKKYEEELRLQDAITRATDAQANAGQAVIATLEAQKQIDLARVKTAAEKLAIEQQYQNKLKEREGIPVSDAEKAEQKKQVAITGQGEADENSRKGDEAVLKNAKDKAQALRDSISGAMTDGAKDGVRGMLSEWAKGAEQMAEKAIFMRVATSAASLITGQKVERGRDAFDRPDAPMSPDDPVSKATGAPQLPGVAGIAGAVLGGKKGAPQAPGVFGKAGPLGGILGAIFGKSDDEGAGGQRIQNATINIENARENIQRATITTGAGTGQGGGSSGGSLSTGDQRWDTVLGVLGI